MAYTVKLTFQVPSRVLRKGQEVYRLRCVASDPVDMPAEIFLHQKTTVDPVTERSQDEFVTVCDPWGLSTYPANAPDAEQDPPFFRKSVVDILLPSSDMYTEVKQAIIDQVTELIAAMDRLDDMVAEQILWIPEEP